MHDVRDRVRPPHGQALPYAAVNAALPAKSWRLGRPCEGVSLVPPSRIVIQLQKAVEVFVVWSVSEVHGWAVVSGRVDR